MELKTGHFNIFDILKFVACHPNIPKGDSKHWKEYTQIVNELTKDVPSDKPGWYLWGKFNEIGWWETIYLGKAGYKKTSSLQRRLKDELLEERPAFWSDIFGREIATKLMNKLYNNKYSTQIQRSLRKCHTHYIIWISCSEISEKDIHKEERALIHYFRPANNAQREKFSVRSELTEQIYRLIEEEITKITT